MNSMTETNSNLRQKMELKNDAETDVSRVNQMFDLSFFLKD